MEKPHFAFEKTNFILLAISMVIIIIGFALMSGPGTTESSFEPDIFSFRRIKLAPAIVFFGFISIIFAIMYKPKE